MKNRKLLFWGSYGVIGTLVYGSIFYSIGGLFAAAGKSSAVAVTLGLGVLSILLVLHLEYSHRFPGGGGVVYGGFFINRVVGFLMAGLFFADYWLSTALAALTIVAILGIPWWCSFLVIILLWGMISLKVKLGPLLCLIITGLTLLCFMGILLYAYIQHRQQIPELVHQMWGTFLSSPLNSNIIAIAPGLLMFSGSEAIQQLTGMSKFQKVVLGILLFLGCLLMVPLTFLGTTLLPWAAEHNSAQVLSMLGGDFWLLVRATQIAGVAIIFATCLAAVMSNVELAKSSLSVFSPGKSLSNRQERLINSIGCLIPIMVLILIHDLTTLGSVLTAVLLLLYSLMGIILCSIRVWEYVLPKEHFVLALTERYTRKRLEIPQEILYPKRKGWVFLGVYAAISFLLFLLFMWAIDPTSVTGKANWLNWLILILYILPIICYFSLADVEYLPEERESTPEELERIAKQSELWLWIGLIISIILFVLSLYAVHVL